MVAVGVVNVPTNGRLDMDPMTMRMVEVTQSVPLFGSRGLGRRAAREAVGSEVAAAEATHYELMAAAWEAYADAYFAGELAREAESHRGIMDRLVRASLARYEATTGRLEDVLRAESEQARIVVDIATFRAEELAARARLDALRGVEPGASDDTLAPPPPPRAEDLDALRTAGAHPRVRGLAAETARYRLAAAAARRMTWPDLELRGSYGVRRPLEGGIEQDDMFSLMAGFELPIFAASREFSEAAEMSAMARSAEADRRAAELEIGERTVALSAAIRAGLRTVGLLADTVVVTQRRAVDASWSAYSAGAADLWRVFEASHALYGERVALIRARQDLALNQARLVAASARGDLFGVKAPSFERSRP
jgi:outer membrane protein TolC